MKRNQEKLLTAVVLTLSIALFSTNFLNSEEKFSGSQEANTVIITHTQNF